MSMKLRVIPRNENFYDLFVRAAANVADGAGLLLKLLTDYHEPEAAHAEIRQREHEGDEFTHQIMRALNTTFVTPFDREDIHRLASLLDDILDGIEAEADLLVLHHIEKPLPDARHQAPDLTHANDQSYQTMPGLGTVSRVDH